jgi:hypothetical protein
MIDLRLYLRLLYRTLTKSFRYEKIHAATLTIYSINT